MAGSQRLQLITRVRWGWEDSRGAPRRAPFKGHWRTGRKHHSRLAMRAYGCVEPGSAGGLQGAAWSPGPSCRLGLMR